MTSNNPPMLRLWYVTWQETPDDDEGGEVTHFNYRLRATDANTAVSIVFEHYPRARQVLAVPFDPSNPDHRQQIQTKPSAAQQEGYR